MTRFEHLTAGLLLALAVSTSGCYTKVGFPDPYQGLYGAETDYGASAYWTDSYYPYLPYAPWEAYAGHNWWYEDYHRYWNHSGGHSGWDGVETGRSRYDRGPGIPSGATTGGGGYVGAGSPAPTRSDPATAPVEDSSSGEDSTNPTRQRAVSDDDKDRKKTETTEPTRAGRRR